MLQRYGQNRAVYKLDRNVIRHSPKRSNGHSISCKAILDYIYHRLYILTTGNTSSWFMTFMQFKMFIMHFIWYFVAYSVYLPPVGRIRMHRRYSVLSVILLKLK